MLIIEEQMIPQIETSSILEVGFVAAFENGRREKFGRTTLPEHAPGLPEILRCILEVEPSLREASYIMGMIRIKEPACIIDLDTVEYSRQNIETIIRQLVKPGIILR